MLNLAPHRARSVETPSVRGRDHPSPVRGRDHPSPVRVCGLGPDLSKCGSQPVSRFVYTPSEEADARRTTVVVVVVDESRRIAWSPHSASSTPAREPEPWAARQLVTFENVAQLAQVRIDGGSSYYCPATPAYPWAPFDALFFQVDLARVPSRSSCGPSGCRASQKTQWTDASEGFRMVGQQAAAPRGREEVEVEDTLPLTHVHSSMDVVADGATGVVKDTGET